MHITQIELQNKTINSGKLGIFESYFSKFKIGSMLNKSAITNKDRLCEERTTILSIAWTSPAREQGLLYKQISFFKCKAV